MNIIKGVSDYLKKATGPEAVKEMNRYIQSPEGQDMMWRSAQMTGGVTPISNTGASSWFMGQMGKQEAFTREKIRIQQRLKEAFAKGDTFAVDKDIDKLSMVNKVLKGIGEAIQNR